MTREEFRDKKSKDYRKHRESYGIKDPVYLDEIEEAYYQGMVDADEHPITYDGKAMLYVNSRSHENGYKEAIEKACEWLDTNYEDIGIRYIRGEERADFIERFKEAMKGE